MLLARENGSIKIYAETYRLEFAKDRPFVYLQTRSGEPIADLFVLSGVQPLNGRDDTTRVGEWQMEEGLSEITIWLTAESAAWESKVVRFRCMPRRFTYQVEVTGSGQLAEVQYFGGCSSALPRWGSGFFFSGQRFKQGFNPEPDCDEVYTFPAEASAAINLTGVPLPGRGDWFFTPSPYCLAFETSAGWMSLGIEAPAGENTYTDYRYHGRRGSFHLSLDYEGYTAVEGRKALPAVAFDFGPDPYTLLAMHVQHLRAAGLAPIPARGPRPAWWSEPIFCGWGAQCYLSSRDGGRAPEFATQANYEGFLASLAAQDVLPGTVVLDDKWQSTYGDNQADPAKWPDLPGFVAARHAAGQRVLLWLKAWDFEGLPIEECITNAAGQPVAVDPTSPAYERRLRAAVRRMLSPEGYDCDGFKIDFSARIPSGPGMQAHGSAWGLELMRALLHILYEEAHRVKPDALVITHTPHPYLASVLDAVRLNDINTAHDVCRQMTHRARVAAIACPEALIDMDNWPMRDRAEWRAYLALKPMLGVPALYFASHFDATGEPLSDEDYALIRAVWAAHRAAAARATRIASAKLDVPGGSYDAGQSRMVKRLPLDQTPPGAGKPLKSWGRGVYPTQP